MAADAAAPPDSALPAEDGSGYEDEEEECRICRLPAEAGRPLRHPCGCRGSIRFVHDDCQLRWLATRDEQRCELCNRSICTRPLYAADTPVRLPVSEFMTGLCDKIMGLLLPLLFAIQEFIIHLTTFGAWCLALARSFVQVHYILSLCQCSASVLASSPIFIRRGFDIFLRGVVGFIPVANVWLNALNANLFHPLLLAWSLHICSSKMFGATMPESFKSLFASSFASTALHWIIGCTFENMRLRLFRFLYKILRPKVAIPFVRYNVREPFYKFYFKKLRGLFYGIISMAMVIFVPIQIASRLAPELFPLDITYFSCPANGTSCWQTLRNYIDLVSRALLLTLLVENTNTLIYLEWLLKTMAFNTWCLRRSVALHIIRSVVLAWLTVVLFNSFVLIFPISIGRALLLAITRLPLAAGLKSNDLLALAVGYGIISTTIAASRDSFAYMASGRTQFLALSRSLMVLLWFVIVPSLIGLLVDLLLISPFIGPDEEVPVLGLFYYWTMGCLFRRIWVKLVQRTRVTPFLAYFIDVRWRQKLNWAKLDWISGLRPMWWFFPDVCIPIATKLLAALGVPYVLAKGVLPTFGYSAAVNSAVYRFAWLGSIGPCALCYLAKAFCIMLHDLIRDDRYIIGLRLEDAEDSSLRNLFQLFRESGDTNT